MEENKSQAQNKQAELIADNKAKARKLLLSLYITSSESVTIEKSKVTYGIPTSKIR